MQHQSNLHISICHNTRQQMHCLLWQPEEKRRCNIFIQHTDMKLYISVLFERFGVELMFQQQERMVHGQDYT